MKYFGWRILRRCHSRGNSHVKGTNGFNTGIRVYDSFERRSVPLVSHRPDLLTWYACGPTVYDSAHIGHASCYVKQDVVRRIVEGVFGVPVALAMSVTDIDDKIVARSQEEKVPFTVITNRYEREFFSDLDKLGVISPLVRCRVTDNINVITDFVQRLVSHGHAYPTSDGSVYFRVSSSTSYGKFGSAGDPASINPAGHDVGLKEDIRDWAVWKGAKKGEPFWQSPWGPGRPGWHVECSAMASWLFGNEVDVHSGGVDLAFPHHENEEAQSCSYHQVDQWVRHWLHFGHLNLKGDIKMSKSLKNTISIREFLETYSSDHMRMLCLLTKYRNGIEFSDQIMENAVAVCRKFQNFLHDCTTYIHGVGSVGDVNEVKLFSLVADIDQEVRHALADNFDTSKAATKLLHLVTTTNSMLHSTENLSASRSVLPVIAARNLISKYLNLFGFSLDSKESSRNSNIDIDSILKSSVEFRSQVRSIALSLPKEKEMKDVKGKLLQQCDLLRADLADQGVELKDIDGCTSWNLVK